MPPSTSILAYFTDPSGYPSGPLVIDGAGDLFGTTVNGHLFELADTGGAYGATPTLVSSSIATSYPVYSDSAGNLFITQDYSIIEFPITPTGYSPTPVTVYSYAGSTTLGNTRGAVITTPNGTLFGVANSVNRVGGDVYSVIPASARTVYPIDAAQGVTNQYPYNSLVLTTSGMLDGTIINQAGHSSLFQLPSSGLGGPSIVLDFGTTVGPLAVDAAADVFTETFVTGATTAQILEVSAGTQIPLVVATIAVPTSGTSTKLLVDAAGDLFGTTSPGNTTSGTVFEIQKSASGYNSTPVTIATFNAYTIGDGPNGLVADAAGNLFGDLSEGGNDSAASGGIFEITNSGFQIACFVQGTEIMTACGPIPVERLQQGERIRSVFGGTVQVTWLGHRRVDCTRHPNPEAVWPVRVCTDAFGPGLPRRPLRVSPDHALHVDDVLIPARCLVNGSSIVQEPVAEVTYWHVELPTHDVILAEGLPCESYLDTGNRSAFANGGPVVAAHPEFASAVWNEQACLPQLRQGPRLAAIHAALVRRAVGLGYFYTAEMGSASTA